MGILDRIIRLERKKGKPFFDDNMDGFVTALLGDDIENYKEFYNQKSGWNIYSVLDSIAADVWSDYADEWEEI